MNIGWVKVKNKNPPDLGGGYSIPEYVVVLDGGAIQEVRQMRVANFWPSEIKELERLRAEGAELIPKALLAKVIMGHDARIMESKVSKGRVAGFSCSHMTEGELAEFYRNHPNLRCATCWLGIEDKKREAAATAAYRAALEKLSPAKKEKKPGKKKPDKQGKEKKQQKPKGYKRQKRSE